MCRIDFLLLLSCATAVRNFFQWAIMPFISWMIWMAYSVNKLNNIPLLVASFFVLRYLPGNIPSLCFSNFDFRPGALGFFQLVAGIRFHTQKSIRFFCRNILCVYFNISGVSMEIVTFYFIKHFLVWMTGW